MSVLLTFHACNCSLCIADSGDFSSYQPLPTSPAPHRRPSTTTTLWSHRQSPPKIPYRKKEIMPKKTRKKTSDKSRKIPRKTTQTPHRLHTDSTQTPHKRADARKKMKNKTNKKSRTGALERLIKKNLKKEQKDGGSTNKKVGRCNLFNTFNHNVHLIITYI